MEQQAFQDKLGRLPMVSAPGIEELSARFRGQDILMAGNGPTAMRDLTPLDLPIWTVNGGWRIHKNAALCFMMDDLEGPAWDLAGTPAAPREFWEPITRACPVPILTAKAYPKKFPQTVEYPLRDVMDGMARREANARYGLARSALRDFMARLTRVLQRLAKYTAPVGVSLFLASQAAAYSRHNPRLYFAETVCYATAWAVHINVKSITFAGCDYGTIRPAERAGLEYWIGRAEEAGIPVRVLPGSQLLSTGRLDGKNRHVPGLYGYDDWPEQLEGAGFELGDFPMGTGLDDSDARLGHEALDVLLAESGVQSVLDVGCGRGDHAVEMATAGKRVIGVDPNCVEDYNTQQNGGSVFFLRQDYLDPEFPLSEQFDAVWSCHVLEHVDNPQAMLRKMRGDLRDGGLLVLTVPPAQHAVVGGHFTLWNGGLLLYHLVRAGFDCREARIKQYGYNLSIIVRKRSVPDGAVPLEPNYPIERLKEYLPPVLEWQAGTFNGDIRNLNW